MAPTRRHGRLTKTLVLLMLLTLLSCMLQAPYARAAPAAAGAAQHYVNSYGAYGFAYPGNWSTRRENRPTDVFVLAPDRLAGLRVLVLPETVEPSPAVLQWLVQAIVQPAGSLTSTPVVRDLNVQGEGGLATAVFFRLHNGTPGLLMVMLVAHAGSLYVLAGAVVNQRARDARRDAVQMAGIMLSLTFVAGGGDPSIYSSGSYAPGNDWSYVGVGGDAGGDGQCSYYDDPDTGSSVMVGNC